MAYTFILDNSFDPWEVEQLLEQLFESKEKKITVIPSDDTQKRPTWQQLEEFEGALSHFGSFIMNEGAYQIYKITSKQDTHCKKIIQFKYHHDDK